MKFRKASMYVSQHLCVAVLFTCAACTGAVGASGGDDTGRGATGGAGGGSKAGSAGTASAGSGGAPSECTQTGVVPGPGPLVRLSATEYKNTVRDLFANITVNLNDLTVPAEVQSDGFLNTAEAQAPSAVAVEAFSGNAQSLAKLATADLGKFLPCTAATASAEASCGSQFIATFGKRALRRPLTSEETTRFTKYFEDSRAKWGFPSAVRLMTEVLLQSPTFLYRLETNGTALSGGKVVALDDYAMASRLSYLLLDTMPDAMLMAAADAGKLRTPAGIETEARRLLGDAKARAAVADFHAQWLRFEKMNKLVKAADLFPTFNQNVALALQTSTARYIDHVFWDEGRTLESLLTDKHAYINDLTAPLYGVTAPAGGTLTWSGVDAKQRSGILTQAGLMAGFAHERNDAPVLRGVFVLDRMLCQPPPPPDPKINTTLPDLTNNSATTTRQQLEASHVAPACATCHKSIDGIGFGFEHYDAVGKWRDKEFNQPVDATGEFSGTADIDGPFDGAVQMGTALARSRQVRSCLASQWLGYALAVRRDNLDACMIDPLVSALESANGDLRELLVAVVKSDAFRHRPAFQQ